MKIDVKQIIRACIITFAFLSLTTLYGAGIREAHQYIFMLGGMILFGFLLDNIWISIFLWWTVFLQIFFKQSNVGSVYLSNIFFGCVLYFLTKLSFKKEHIPLFLNAILWLTAVNLLYMNVQMWKLDWIYAQGMYTTEGFKGYTQYHDPTGFMSFKACMGMLMAMAIPILASKPYKMGLIAALLLFVPLYISQASICILAGVVGFIFALVYKNFKFKKIAIALIGIMLISGAVFYAYKIDDTPTSMTLRFVAWQGILKDTTIHPITGWGLDSFRNITTNKKHLYCMNPTEMQTQKGVHMDYLDNPHNLYISLMYEWGIVGIIILIGLLRKYGLMFKNAIKSHETMALAGFLLVTLIVSVAQFPLFLARLVVLIVPVAALWEIQTK